MELEEVSIQDLQEITDDFSKERILGEGAFGVVYKGVTKNGDDVAVKKLKLRDDNLDYKEFQNEFYNLRKLKHQNIVQVLGYCFDEEEKHFSMPDGSKMEVKELCRALCFEYLSNGGLQKHLSDQSCEIKLDWHTRFKIIKGTCEGLKYLHEELNIYHLDLKPDNILLDKDMVPKIADFGLSRKVGKEVTQDTEQRYGTLGYQPPEHIKNGEISEKFDIFSLGVVMIKIVSGLQGYSKFQEMISNELDDQVRNDIKEKFVDQVQENWRNMLQSACSSDFLLEKYCNQVKTCTHIGLNCVENESQKRPRIVEINEKLNEICMASSPEMARASGEFLHNVAKACAKNEHEVRDSFQELEQPEPCQTCPEIIDTGKLYQKELKTGPGCSELEFVNAGETSSVVVEQLIVGRTEEKETVIASLLEAMSKKSVILPIHGIGGIGKTTLARLIYNDPKFKDYSHAWVNVSPTFDCHKIHESIISQLSEKESHATERKTIQELLYGKKTMIILDDLWQENQFELQELKDMLYYHDSNIITLVTTRSERVAKRICTNIRPYKILLLGNDMCWDLIKQRSGFKDRDDKKQLEDIGLEIAQKCGGVPLAALSLGFTLQSKNFDQWMKVKDSNIWKETVSKDLSLPKHVLASLMISYSYMSPCLKRCFTYCAIFPKGHKIVKSDVIYQWVSLDFIETRKLLSSMQICENYILQLLGLSFFQHSLQPKTVGVQQEDITVFTMHDLVHDLARTVMVDEILDASEQGNMGGRGVQFALLNDCTRSLKSFTQYPAKIRALHFIECDKTELLGALFSFADGLCVLDLSECWIQKLPDPIGNLKQLRYLKAPRIHHHTIPICVTKLSKLIYLSLCGSSEILELPDSIGKMEDLMFLDLSGCTWLERLPLSFGKLKKLVHLDLSNCSFVTGLSESLKSLTNLEYLDLSYCSQIWKLPKHLGNLSKLRNLNLSYSSYLEGSLARDTKVAEVLVSLTKLECLNLSSRTSYIRIPKSFSRLTNLKYLNLSGSYGIGIQETLGSYTKLQYLNLSSCPFFRHEDKLHPSWISEVMGNLTELRYLNLSHCPDITGDEKVFSIFIERLSNLPNLEHLDLSNTRTLTSLPDCFGSFRKLHTLDLSHCTDLQSLPATLHEIYSLKFLHLDFCTKLNMSNIPPLNKNSITLPHFLVQADYHDSSSNLVLLQNVNRYNLVISRLENVMSVQEAHSIKLAEKESLEVLELNWTGDAERLVEDMELLGELVPPSNLVSFGIYGYNSARFPEWFVGPADHLPNLVRISLSNLPKCNNLQPLCQLPSLKELDLSGMNGISKIDADLCGTTRLSFPQIERFSLREMENLEVWYTTYPCDGEDVCEFMFPNLDVLEITDCPSLRMKPCPHRARIWSIKGRCDGVISSCRETASVTSTSSPAFATVRALCESVDVPMHQWTLLQHLPALQTLLISGCSDLSSSTEIIRSLSSLQSLFLYHDSRLPNWLGQLTALKFLEINGSQGKPLQDNESINTTPLPSLEGLISLQTLKISQDPDLNDLLQTIGHLISLKELSFSSCHSITSLPESIGGLASLNKLEFFFCKNITSLPESIQQLTKLEKLEISLCYKLSKWCKTEENMMKLAHIKEKKII